MLLLVLGLKHRLWVCQHTLGVYPTRLILLFIWSKVSVLVFWNRSFHEAKASLKLVTLLLFVPSYSRNSIELILIFLKKINLLFSMLCATELTDVYWTGSVSLSVCSVVYLTAVLRLNEGIVPRLGKHTTTKLHSFHAGAPLYSDLVLF